MTIEELLRLPEFARWNEMAFAESRRKLENQYIALNAFARRGQAVMAGDSIVELFPLQEFFGGRIYNRGVGGDTSGDTLRRLERIVLPLQPGLTLLWVGTNDIEAGVPLSQTVQNVEKIGTRLEDTCESRILLLSVAPVNATSADPAIRQAVGKRTNVAVAEMNEAYCRLCESKGWRFLDVFSRLQKSGSLPDELSEDGLHPNVSGYSLAAPVITAALN
ncbi:MAG: hypothetical protein IJU28_08000 [Clostridia bacterium]|nr:hypothetical protein [Clostridia bacterium]